MLSWHSGAESVVDGIVWIDNTDNDLLIPVETVFSHSQRGFVE